MKKWLTLALACMLLLAPVTQALGAEAAQTKRAFDEFVIGTTTQASGAFFSNMFGYNTTDIDIRAMLHGYSPIYWSQQTTYDFNYQVIEGITTGEYSDGNKLYQISLHKDLKYNDGSPIQASDYVFSLLLLASPALAELGGNTSGLDYIAGFDEYNAGDSTVFSGVKLVDAYTFSIEVKAAYLPYFYELSMLDIQPYPISLIAPECEVTETGEGVKIQNKGDGYSLSKMTTELLQKTILDPNTGYLSHPSVTSGPYTLVSYDDNEGVARFKINPYFKGTYDGAVPTIDNLVVRPVTTENMVQVFQNGEVQLLSRVTSGQNITDGLAAVSAMGASSANYPRLGLGFVSFSADRAPFQSEAVRKAVAYALDTDGFCASFSPYCVPVYGYMGMGQWMYQMVNMEDAPEFATTQAEEDRWKALSLDSLNTYSYSLEKAEQLLIDDGWTLNEHGRPYIKGTDTLRHKDIQGTLTSLTIRWARSTDSLANEVLESMLPPALATIGMSVQIYEMPFTTMLEDYYSAEGRQYDMYCLATDFHSNFDPSRVFGTDPAYRGIDNTTGIVDYKMERLALEMRATQPGDLLTYAEKWMIFQKYWNEKLPLLPLYSSVLFDFFVPELENYHPNKEVGFGNAIVYAYTSEQPPAWLQSQGAVAE